MAVTSTQSTGFNPLSLDAINFLLADVRGALGPYLNVFLVTQQHWSQCQVGLVTTISGLLEERANLSRGAAIRIDILGDTIFRRKACPRAPIGSQATTRDPRGLRPHGGRGNPHTNQRGGLPGPRRLIKLTSAPNCSPSSDRDQISSDDRASAGLRRTLRLVEDIATVLQFKTLPIFNGDRG
jgi:hypothetical protein